MKKEYLSPFVFITQLTQPALAADVDASTDIDFGSVPDED